ncbi:MAG: hypothetical protein ABMA15_03130 [Vicinamibacterales bacterium]
MWFRAGQRRAVSRVLAALLTLVVCGGALDWGHAGGDDADCDPVFVVHDHNAHHISTAPARSTPASDHCYICHTLRLFHTSLTARGAIVVAPVRPASLYRLDAPAALTVVGVALSSRAPPLAL